MIVYKVTNNINGKVYIGKTIKSLHKRKLDHLMEFRANRKNNHLYNAIEKHEGDNFEGEVIYEGTSEEDILEKEYYYVELYEATNTEKGYNKSMGGKGSPGCECSEEHKQRMRENNPMFNSEVVEKVNKTKEENSHLYKPMELTEEERKRRSERMKENNPMHDPETVKKVNEAKEEYYNSEKYKEDKKRNIQKMRESNMKEGEITTPEEETFIIGSLHEFCINNSLSSSDMIDVADNKRKQHKGYKCKRKGGNNNE